MTSSGLITLFIIIANLAVSYKGFSDSFFFEKYNFQVDKIRINRQYYRFLTSGFLHVNWMHLIFNMLSLFFFSTAIEATLGPVNFLVIYAGSLAGGNLLSFWIHRHDDSYSAAGASGAVNGIIFACIALFPGMQILFMPAWLFGLLYVLFSIYGIRSRTDNVGHDAHLGGGLIGLLLAIAIVPQALGYNLFAILAIAIPLLVFILLIIKKPHALLIDNFFYKNNAKNLNADQRYNAARINRQQEIDTILEKIHHRGIKSLSKKEKALLEDYSKKG